MIKHLLWDVDGTLLNFHAAESAAIRKLFSQYSLGECTDKMLARYREINDEFWRKLESGELTKPQILTGRFAQFFRECGICTDVVEAFNRDYQLAIGDTVVYNDDSLQIVQSLQGKVKQYVVSNGTVVAQNKKLEKSGLGARMEGIFLSEQLGAEKPNIAFFEKVFAQIRPDSLSEVMIVGDSLTSDIRGGMNAGIKTCWYNKKRKTASAEYRIDYEITDLHEVPVCLEKERE